MAKNFVISTDTCADLPRSFYEANGIHYIVMKRILRGADIAEVFDAEEDFDKFYDDLKKGDLPTTTQLNPYELKEHFEGVLSKTEGDIIHVALSSGLSTTCGNAVLAAEEVNAELEAKNDARRVYVVDSLIATLGMAQLTDRLMELRDAGASTADAVANIENLREHQQGWVIMTDLFHLCRGGRISGIKAAIGTVLKLRPIIHLSKKGKLAIENKIKGNIKAVQYILTLMEKYGAAGNPDFDGATVWVVRTSKSDLCEQLEAAIRAKYPRANIKHGIVGSVIGTHLGCGGVCCLWEGAPRLDIN